MKIPKIDGATHGWLVINDGYRDYPGDIYLNVNASEDKPPKRSMSGGWSYTDSRSFWQGIHKPDPILRELTKKLDQKTMEPIFVIIKEVEGENYSVAI